MGSQRHANAEQWAGICAQLGLNDVYRDELWRQLDGSDHVVLTAQALRDLTRRLGWPDEHAAAIWKVACTRLAERTAPPPAQPAFSQPEQQPAAADDGSSAFTVPEPHELLTAAPQVVHAGGDETLTETEMSPRPAQAAVSERTLASMPKRAAAHLIDLALFGLAAFALSWAGSLLLSGVEDGQFGALDFGATALVGLGAVYAPVISSAMWAIWQGKLQARRGERNGQSWGKQIVGVRVVRLDLQPVDFGVAVLREGSGRCFGLWVAALLYLFAVVLIAMTSTSFPSLLASPWFAFAAIGAIYYFPAFRDRSLLTVHDRLAKTAVVNR